MTTINKAYWDKFYRDWDNFVANWFKERKGEATDDEYKIIAKAYENAVAKLEFDELPTPYLGKPHEGVDAVILNLNPGLSEKIGFGKFAGRNSDETQYYSHIEEEIGWLIRKFRDGAGGLYSHFVGIDSNINYSCLNPELLDTAKYPDWVCGVNWWQGYDKKVIENKYRVECARNRDKRMPWLRQIYNKDISSAKVFALELCPYHSKEFIFANRKLNGGDRNCVLTFIADNVIHPALMAVVENNLDFAVAIGEPTAIYLEQHLKEIGGGEYGIEATLEKEWWEATDGIKDLEWPTKTDGKTGMQRFTCRKYCLFALKDNCGRLARFLVTAAPGGNTAPSKEFGEKVEEKLVLKYVKENRLTEEIYKKLQPLPIRWWNNMEDSYKVEAKVIRQKSLKKSHDSGRNNNQVHNNLWNRFTGWCRDNNKSWISPKYANQGRVIYPAGGSKYLFKIVDGQLYLGIYCSVNECQRIRDNYKDEFGRRYGNENVSWGNPTRKKYRTIMLLISGDWRNPSDSLFEKMANAFEVVKGDVE